MSPSTCPASRTERHARGLSLIEVVVATAIFSVAIASLLIVRNRAIDQTAVAKNERLARRLAMQILEEIHGGKDYEVGGQEFDREKYPGFYYDVKEVETVEAEEPEDSPFKKREQGGGGGAPSAALLKKLLAKGKSADELKRYVVDLVFPAPTDTGQRTVEVVTYHLHQAEGGQALLNAMRGQAGILGGAVAPRGRDGGGSR